MKIYIVRSDPQIERMFSAMGFTPVDSLSEAEMVYFTGGSDISPYLYQEPKHPFTKVDSERDRVECAFYENARERNLPMVGICRGGQFLNVMNGGKLWQHVTKHTKPHMLTDLRTKKEYFVSSTHHQMMIPAVEALIVATAKVEDCRVFDHANNLVDYDTEEIEAVWYPNTKCLCFQPHPELDLPAATKEYFHSLLTYFFR